MADKKSEAKEVFEAFSPSEYGELVESVVESIDIAVFAVNRQGNGVVWNRAMERYFIAHDEAVGKHLLTVFPGFKTEQQGVKWRDVLLKNVIKEGRSIEVHRYKLPTRVTEAHPFDIKASPLKSRGGKISGAVMLLADVRERVELEEQQILTARTTSLSNLGASLAHEIRNPLNSISLNVQLLRERILKLNVEEKDELTKSADVLLNEIERLNLIVKDFLEFSRPSSMRNVMANPNDVIGPMLELLKEDARRKDIEVIVDYGKLPEVMLDRNQMTQVFYNIALNAIQVMDKGGKLEIVSRRRGDWVVVEFTDNGPGIAQENLSRIFDLFYTSREKGMGLGLAIASKLTENHHGHIAVNSLEGKGTTFSVFLPTKIVSE